MIGGWNFADGPWGIHRKLPRRHGRLPEGDATPLPGILGDRSLPEPRQLQ